VLALAAGRGLRAVVVTGEVEPGTTAPVTVLSLVERFGRRRAWSEPADCIAAAVADELA
jgi:hypothetical protein